MEDVLLNKAFTERERWDAAIKKAFTKKIPQRELRALADERTRVNMYMAIRDGKYRIAPPHTAEIPKDDGGVRTVYINENIDRVLLSLINDLLFDMFPEMVHNTCKSYQKGLSSGKTVVEFSRCIENWPETHGHIGFKADLSKYFDSVPIEFIDKAFDDVESAVGHSALIDVLRDYYHNDLYFDLDGELKVKYQSLKQGCAVASWLADVVLYDVDHTLDSEYNGRYVRYSDDILYIGTDWELAKMRLGSLLEKKGLTLNPKKVELIDKRHWVKFLGFSIRGKEITLSKKGVESFKNAINAVTTKKKGSTMQSAIRDVNRALYRGFDDYSWAKRVLSVINVEHDINELNNYAMDAIRATATGRKHIGGIGYRKEQKDGVVFRGTGRNVKANREKIPKIDGYNTIMCMFNALHTSGGAFEALIRVDMK